MDGHLKTDSDIALFRKILEAERQASRITGEAERQAAAMKEDAAARAAGMLRDRRDELARKRGDILEEAVGAAEREAQALVEGARRRAERLARERESAIDPLVDRLLDMLLPR